MPDLQFEEPRLAALYDAFCSGRPDFAFYLPLVMRASAVLDVGCGTGALLHLARDAGHEGRLCGLDPAAAMLEQARARTDVEWHHGDLATTTWTGAFDLAVMTGHAFQTFTNDGQTGRALAAIHDALRPGGRFAFETRNPLARAWETWTPANATEITGRSGAVVRCEHTVERVVGDLVTFTARYRGTLWGGDLVSTSTLRFIDHEAVDALLERSGFVVETQLGDWDRGPSTPASAEIITIARRA